VRVLDDDDDDGPTPGERERACRASTTPSMDAKKVNATQRSVRIITNALKRSHDVENICVKPSIGVVMHGRARDVKH